MTDTTESLRAVLTPETLREWANHPISTALSANEIRAMADAWEICEAYHPDHALKAEVVALEARLEAAERVVEQKMVQWGWDGSLPMRYGFCYLCGQSHEIGHTSSCGFTALARSTEEKP